MNRVIQLKKDGDFFSLTVEWNGKRPLPGQFFMLTIPDRLDTFLPRPFSVYDAGEGFISFLVKIKGRFTGILSSLREGDEIKVKGPYGNLAPVVSRAIFVGGGIGIAPLHYHAQFTDKFVFIGGFPTGEGIGFIKDLEKKGEILFLTEDGSVGKKGIVTDVLECVLRKYPDYTVFACGPFAMLENVVRMARKTHTVFVYMEQFMACGTGGCKGCAINTEGGYKLVCRDGPVFKGEEVFPG